MKPSKVYGRDQISHPTPPKLPNQFVGAPLACSCQQLSDSRWLDCCYHNKEGNMEIFAYFWRLFYKSQLHAILSMNNNYRRNCYWLIHISHRQYNSSSTSELKSFNHGSLESSHFIFLRLIIIQLFLHGLRHRRKWTAKTFILLYLVSCIRLRFSSSMSQTVIISWKVIWSTWKGKIRGPVFS